MQSDLWKIWLYWKDSGNMVQKWFFSRGYDRIYEIYYRLTSCKKKCLHVEFFFFFTIFLFLLKLWAKILVYFFTTDNKIIGNIWFINIEKVFFLEKTANISWSFVISMLLKHLIFFTKFSVHLRRNFCACSKNSDIHIWGWSENLLKLIIMVYNILTL